MAYVNKGLAIKNGFRAVCVVFGLLPGTILADTPKIKVETTLGYERGAQIVGGVDAAEMAFEMTPYFYTKGEAVQSLGNGAKLTYGADLRITGNATALGETLTETGLQLNYQRKFGADNAWQFRLRGEIDYAVSTAHWVFVRERVGAQLTYRHSKSHTTVAMLRLGARDQNDTNFDGFDQAEYLAQVTHTWRPRNDRLSFAGTLYAERRDAEADRFSYDEAGIRLMARYPVTKATEITGRTSYYTRDYQDSFSASNAEYREDRRFKATVEVSHDWTDRLSSEAYIGWDTNESNIPERDYSGNTFGISLTYQWQ